MIISEDTKAQQLEAGGDKSPDSPTSFQPSQPQQLTLYSPAVFDEDKQVQKLESASERVHLNKDSSNSDLFGESDISSEFGESSNSEDEDDDDDDPNASSTSAAHGTASGINSSRQSSILSYDEKSEPIKRRGPGRPPGSKNKITVDWNKAQKKRYEQLAQRGGSSGDDGPIAFKTPKKPGRKRKKRVEEDSDGEKKVEEGIMLGGRKRPLPLVQIHERDRSGRSRLFKYASTGDLDSCKKLISVGIDVNIQDYAGWTALHESCLSGQLAVVEFLIKAGANTNSVGGGLDTPLHDAVQNEHFDVVKCLLENGSSITALNDKKQTPLDVSENKRIRTYLETWTLVLKKVLTRDAQGITPLHSECSAGNVVRIKEYIKLGANVNAKDNANWTPLHEAALNGHCEACEILLKHGADVDVVSVTGDTPLIDASANKHPKCVLILLQYGARPLQKNDKGKSSLDFGRDDKIGRSEEQRIILEYLTRDESSWKPYRQAEYKIENSADDVPITASRPDSPVYDGNIFTMEEMEQARHSKGKRRASIESQETNASARAASGTSTKSLAAWWGASEQTFPSSREERKFQALLKTLEQNTGDQPLSDPVRRRKSNNFEHVKKSISEDEAHEDRKLKKRSSVPPPIKIALPKVPASSASAGEVVKRKRGRPRKNPLPENIPAVVKMENDDDDPHYQQSDSPPPNSPKSENLTLKYSVVDAKRSKTRHDEDHQPILLKAKKRFSDEFHERSEHERLGSESAFDANNSGQISPRKKKHKIFGDSYGKSMVVKNAGLKSPDILPNAMDRRISSTSNGTSFSDFKLRKSWSFAADGEEQSNLPRKKKKNWLGISAYKSIHEVSAVVSASEPQIFEERVKNESVDASSSNLLEPRSLQTPHAISKNGYDALERDPENAAIIKRIEISKLFTIRQNGEACRSLVDLQVGLLWGLKSGRALVEKFPHLQCRVATALEKAYLESSPLSACIYESMVAQGSNPRWLKTVDTKDGRLGLELVNLDIQFLREDQVMQEFEAVWGPHNRGGLRQILKFEELDIGLKPVFARQDIACEEKAGYVHKLKR